MVEVESKFLRRQRCCGREWFVVRIADSDGGGGGFCVLSVEILPACSTAAMSQNAGPRDIVRCAGGAGSAGSADGRPMSFPVQQLPGFVTPGSWGTGGWQPALSPIGPSPGLFPPLTAARRKANRKKLVSSDRILHHQVPHARSGRHSQHSSVAHPQPRCPAKPAAWRAYQLH